MSIKLSHYSGGIVYRHFYTLKINFNADGNSGTIEVKKDQKDLSPISFNGDFADKIKKIVEQSKITEIPSASNDFDDMGYGATLLHLNFLGKSFLHTPPSGCIHNTINTPTKDQQAIFNHFTSDILHVTHDLFPSLPTSSS